VNDLDERVEAWMIEEGTHDDPRRMKLSILAEVIIHGTWCPGIHGEVLLRRLEALTT